MGSFLFEEIRWYSQISICIALFAMLAGCAKVSVTPRGVQQENPAMVADALEAARTAPTQVAVRDFTFYSSSVKENGSPLHRGVDLFRRSSADKRRAEIARDAAATLSTRTAKRLAKTGLPAVRMPGDSDATMYNNSLLVTGRMIDVDEGNRFTRIALGLGAGESRLDTEVHVYRVVEGEKAEVLTFITHADSGKMPGLLPSMGAGELVLGPITAITMIEDAASSGQKIYASQIEYLAGKTADQVSNYVSQYAADNGWIPRSKAKPVKLAAG
jgi:hypothetical protein